MPAAIVLTPLNQMMSDPTSREYRDVAAAVEAAGTVHDAVTGTGVLGRFEADVVTEAHAVLDAIPPAIDGAIMAALASAFGRGVPVALTWIEDLKVAVRVWEQPHRGRVLVNILFMSPNGQTFV
jgi:hypothetical protein